VHLVSVSGVCFLSLVGIFLLSRWCHHLNAVGEFASFRDPESYADGSVATGRVSQAGQVKR
jgi:hypothetical protein